LAILLTREVFAFFAVVVGLVRSRTQLSLTNCLMLLSHHLELTMTAIKTGAVGINQGH